MWRRRQNRNLRKPRSKQLASVVSPPPLLKTRKPCLQRIRQPSLFASFTALKERYANTVIARESIKQNSQGAARVTCLLPGATDTEVFDRGRMMDTALGYAPKSDPLQVAKTGFDAMMRGDQIAVHGLSNKLINAGSGVLPRANSRRSRSTLGAIIKKGDCPVLGTSAAIQAPARGSAQGARGVCAQIGFDLGIRRRSPSLHQAFRQT